MRLRRKLEGDVFLLMAVFLERTAIQPISQQTKTLKPPLVGTHITQGKRITSGGWLLSSLFVYIFVNIVISD